jgi:hypothetical protein
MRIGIAALAIGLLDGGPAASGEAIVPVTRAQMLEVAKAMAEHKWVCKASNLKASCLTRYRSHFKKDQAVVGVAYDWGGMDDMATFDKKLKTSQAAGSHQEEGASSCTTGVDCSGLLSLCWRQTIKFGTANIGTIAPTLQQIDRLTDLRVGDALNKPGSHIVMFAGYNPDGTIDVYEARGSAARVVLTRRNEWTRFTNYVAIRYKGTVD